MKRLALILAGVVVAGGAAATPAIAGLAGNPSFSHEIPVPVPSAAKTPAFADDHSRDGATVPASATARRRRRPRRHDPARRAGDERRVTRGRAGDDHGGITPHAEPGDDHGGLTPHAEPGDDPAV